MNQQTNYSYGNGATNQGTYANSNYAGYNNANNNNYNAQYSDYNYQNSSTDGMFKDVGKKIETYAKVCMYICIGIACLMLFASFGVRGYGSGYAILVALITGGIIILIGYISALMVFGYGKLIENVEEIKNMLKDKESK